MSHGIELNDTMFSARQVPWHGLGTVVEEELLAAEALKTAGLDWEVILAPAIAEVPGLGDQPTNAYFPMAKIDGQYEFIGNATRVVSDKYELFQNANAFSFLDNLVDQGLKYSTAGSLRNRAWVWATAKLPQTILLGGEEAHDIYLLISNSHDGTKAVRVDVTPVRVVCQNTLNLAWGSARQSWSARHLSSIEGRVEEARKTLDLSFSYLDDWKINAELLLATVFDDKQLIELLDNTVEESPRDNIHKTTIRSLFSDSPTIKGTIAEGNAWGAVNAIGEYYDHIRFANPDGRNTESSQAVGSWEGVGARTRNRAVKLLLS
jgi:phage/plasmid-like protein (TIGR03299 family)